ncbi:MAG: tetratricopeptide repeat protein [Planctomycetota bacterium]|nr:tetratricopeptide repeat protein [Planctomycetota bacterium]
MGNLGLVHLARGDPGRAETMFKTAIETNGPRGDRRIMADSYGNLGLAYIELGALGPAEAAFRKFLEIQRIARPPARRGRPVQRPEERSP